MTLVLAVERLQRGLESLATTMNQATPPIEDLASVFRAWREWERRNLVVVLREILSQRVT